MIIHLPQLVEGAGYQIVRLRAAPVDRDWVEPVARAIHDRYLARRAEDGQDEADSAIPWEELERQAPGLEPGAGRRHHHQAGVDRLSCRPRCTGGAGSTA